MEEQSSAALSVEGGESPKESVHPMAELLREDNALHVPQRGENIEGTIISMSPSEVLVDIGYKTEGVVTSRDLDRLDQDFRSSLKVGDSVLVNVLRPEDKEGNIILSLSRAQLESDWREAEKLFEAEQIIEREVVDCNQGGVIVNLARVRGFVPASQVVSLRIPRGGDDTERERMLRQLIGRPLSLKIIELDRRRNRLILSERAALREWREEQKERLLRELSKGEIRHGVVSSLCDFGAFVDLGGADGLVHLSELSWRRIGHPREVLKVGQEVDVCVLSVDKERQRIALSLKRLQEEPWSTVDERFNIGMLVTGTVTKLTNFGAFVRVDEAIEGLVHISEISEERIVHPRDVLTEGQEITVRVIRIEAERQRMGLSLRRVEDDSYSDDYDWEQSDQVTELGGGIGDTDDS